MTGRLNGAQSAEAVGGPPDECFVDRTVWVQRQR